MKSKGRGREGRKGKMRGGDSRRLRSFAKLVSKEKEWRGKKKEKEEEGEGKEKQEKRGRERK